jgi:hypothetical protein
LACSKPWKSIITASSSGHSFPSAETTTRAAVGAHRGVSDVSEQQTGEEERAGVAGTPSAFADVVASNEPGGTRKHGRFGE